MIRYGKKFPEGVSPLDIELWCYAHDGRADWEGGRLSKEEHFWKAVDLLWNVPGSTRSIIRNEWTERMVRAMMHNRYTSLAGAASSGKSESAALFALVEWLAAPSRTLVFVLSTTITGAQFRIWKSVSTLWSALEARWEAEGVGLPGKMVASECMIRGMDMNGKYDHSIGIKLIAADKDNEAQASKKLKGLKAPAEGKGRLRVIADEMSDLGDSVRIAMLGNLSTNPDFKGIGMSNPDHRLNPFGLFSCPKGGWKNLDYEADEWETEVGVCLRFDALRSPRVLTPEHEDYEKGTHKLYNWMSSKAVIDQMGMVFGEESREYWAQVKGIWAPGSDVGGIWSEAELVKAMDPVDEEEWDHSFRRINVGALDCAFTTDGDRTVFMVGRVGRLKGGRMVLEFQKSYVLSDIVSEGEGTLVEKMINQMRKIAQEHNIEPRNIAYDSTGGGEVFGQWIESKWSAALLKVNFSASPIERRSSLFEREDIYGNRVSQLWVQPKALVREGQIRGMLLSTAEELCKRKFSDKQQTGGKIWIESKKDLKKRIGKSPDEGDCAMLLCELCIERGLLGIEDIQKQDKRVMEVFRANAERVFQPGRNRGMPGRPQHKRLRY